MRLALLAPTSSFFQAVDGIRDLTVTGVQTCALPIFDNRLIHVPLVASGPAPLAAPGAWSLADFPRLLADTLGLEGHPWADDGAGAPAGVAVAQLDALAEPNHPRLLRAVEEWHLDDDAVRRMTSPATCATDGH